ncbi:MAG: transporter substrate-binding domain-containing protein [Kofleriaceae bacterium]
MTEVVSYATTSHRDPRSRSTLRRGGTISCDIARHGRSSGLKERRSMLNAVFKRGSIWTALVLAVCGVADAAPAAKPAEPELYELDTAPQPAPAAGSPLDRVLKSLQIRACVRSDVAPFGAFTSGGLDGFDVALAREVADEISVDYKQPLRIDWVVVPAADRVKFVQDGACDFEIAAFSHTAERATQVAESKVYLRTDKVVVSAARITRKEPIIGKVGGTTGGDVADLKGKPRSFSTYQELIQAMDLDELDHIVVDRPIAEHLIRSSTRPFKISRVLTEGTESYVVAVHTGHSDLLGAVNRALGNIARSGRLALLHRRWL